MNILVIAGLYRQKRKLYKFRENLERYQKRAQGFQSNISCLKNCLQNEQVNSTRQEIRDEISELQVAANDSDAKAYFWSMRVELLEAKIRKTCKKHGFKMPKELENKSV